MIMEQLLTTEELAKRMRVNPSTVRRWRFDDVGQPYLRVGTVYRYPISAVGPDAGATDRGQGQGCSSAGWSSWRSDHDHDPPRCDRVGRVG